jgi:hypothetical protein
MLFWIKKAVTFAYELEKKCIMYEKKLSTQKVTSDFIGHRLFAQILSSQNSKGKYESRKIFDFVKKMRKIVFFCFLNFFCFLFQFLTILNVSHYIGISKFLYFLIFWIFWVLKLIIELCIKIIWNSLMLIIT